MCRPVRSFTARSHSPRHPRLSSQARQSPSAITESSQRSVLIGKAAARTRRLRFAPPPSSRRRIGTSLRRPPWVDRRETADGRARSRARRARRGGESSPRRARAVYGEPAARVVSLAARRARWFEPKARTCEPKAASTNSAGVRAKGENMRAEGGEHQFGGGSSPESRRAARTS
jgi:hypothetical protein